MNPLSILSIGAGAIGTYIGGSLALQGHKLTFLENAQTAQIIQNQGLHLTIGDQDQHLPSPTVYRDIKDSFNGEKYDIALFALKSFDTHTFIQSVKDYSDVFPAVLCLSNGVENEKFLENVLGPKKVIPGTITTAVGKKGIGNIVLERKRGVGIAAGHPLSERLVMAFNQAGLNAQMVQNPVDMKWSKMLTNLIANATSAILDYAPIRIFKHSGLYQLELQQLRETLQVMKSLDIQVIDLPGTPVRLLGLILQYLPGKISQPIIAKVVGTGRGEKMPSFHIDLYNNRGKSEVDFLNGAVVRFGEIQGIRTNANYFLNEILMGLTSGSIPLEKYRHRPEKLLSDFKAV